MEKWGRKRWLEGETTAETVVASGSLLLYVNKGSFPLFYFVYLVFMIDR